MTTVGVGVVAVVAFFAVVQDAVAADGEFAIALTSVCIIVVAVVAFLAVVQDAVAANGELAVGKRWPLLV